MKRLIVVSFLLNFLTKLILSENEILLLKNFHHSINPLISCGTLTSAETLSGLPHFEIGTGVCTNSIKADYLPFRFVQARMGVYSGIPIFPTINIFSCDIGVKIGVLLQENFIPQNNWLTEGEIRIGIVKGIPFPSIAIITTYNQLSILKIQLIKTKISNFGIKALVSKKFINFTPYGGIGVERMFTSFKYDSNSLEKITTLTTYNLKYLIGMKFGFYFFAFYVEYNYILKNSLLSLGIKIDF